MILPVVVAAQIATPPLAPDWRERPLGFAASTFEWKCNLVDVRGRTFPITGKMPAFAADEKKGARKGLKIVSSEEAALNGEQSVVPYVDGLYNVKLAGKAGDKILSMTLNFQPNGEGQVTVYTEVPSTKAEGYYAAGICQSGFRGAAK